MEKTTIPAEPWMKRSFEKWKADKPRLTDSEAKRLFVGKKQKVYPPIECKAIGAIISHEGGDYNVYYIFEGVDIRHEQIFG